MFSLMSVDSLLISFLIFSPYLVFIFFSESFNPLFKPKVHAERAGWRYGRAMALATIVGNVCTLILSMVGELPLATAIRYGLIVSIFIAGALSAKRLGNLFRT